VCLHRCHQWSTSFRTSFHILKGLKNYPNTSLERLRQAMACHDSQSPNWASNMLHSKHEGTVLMITSKCSILCISITSILHRMLQAKSLNVWWNYNAKQEVMQFPILWMCYPSQTSRFYLQIQWHWFSMSPITSLKLHALPSHAKLEITNLAFHHSSSRPQCEYSLLLVNIQFQNMLNTWLV
jgi:hypothetical protein